MERVQRELELQESKNKLSRTFKIFDNIEFIPVDDFLYANLDKGFT